MLLEVEGPVPACIKQAMYKSAKNDMTYEAAICPAVVLVLSMLLECVLLCLTVDWQEAFKDWNHTLPGRLQRLWGWHLRPLLLPPGGNHFNLCCLAIVRCRGSACKGRLIKSILIVSLHGAASTDAPCILLL